MLVPHDMNEEIVGVLGLGRSGIAAVAALQAAGAHVVAFDDVKHQHDLPTIHMTCLLYTSPSPRDATLSRMPSSA